MVQVEGRTFAHPRELKVGDVIRNVFLFNDRVILPSPPSVDHTYAITQIIAGPEGRYDIHGGPHPLYWSPNGGPVEVISKKGA